MKPRLAHAVLLAPILSACQVDRLLNSPDGGSPPGAPPPAHLAPRDPSGLGQYRLDGTPVGSGGTIGENGIEIRALLSDPEPGDSLRLQLELRYAGTAFTGLPTQLSERVASGSFAIIRIVGDLADTTYQWQVRAVDRAGLASEWVPFSASASFRVSVPRIPQAPVGLEQFRADGETPIPVGGTTPNRDVWLSARVADPRLTGEVRVEFEVRPRDEQFAGSRTHSDNGVEPGEKGRVRFRASAFVAYHWQSRVCQADLCGPWAEFGGNSQHETDFLRNPFEDDDD